LRSPHRRIGINQQAGTAHNAMQGVLGYVGWQDLLNALQQLLLMGDFF
jgi:hypothetical protein